MPIELIGGYPVYVPARARRADTPTALALTWSPVWLLDPSASEGITETSRGSGLIASANDLSGHNRHWTQTDLALCPAIQRDPGADNAMGMYLRGAANARLVGPNLSAVPADDGLELWTVMRWSGTPDAISSQRFLCYHLSNSLSFSPFADGLTYIDALTDSRVDSIPVPMSTLGRMHIQRVVATPNGRWEMFVNGVSVKVRESGNRIALGAAPTIGAVFQNADGFGWVYWQMCVRPLGADANALTALLKGQFPALP